MEARCITKRSLLVALVSGNKSVHYPQRRCGEVGLKVGLSAAMVWMIIYTTYVTTHIMRNIYPLMGSSIGGSV
jgi:hypothetical protein